MIKIFEESEGGGGNPFWNLPFKHSCLVGSWWLVTFSFGVNSNDPQERQQQPQWLPGVLGISAPGFWELWDFFPGTGPSLWSSHPKGYSKGKSYDLFWNSKTFSCCQSWINVSEKIIIARFVKKKKIFFYCCLKTSGKDFLQEEK